MLGAHRPGGQGRRQAAHQKALPPHAGRHPRQAATPARHRPQHQPAVDGVIGHYVLLEG